MTLGKRDCKESRRDRNRRIDMGDDSAKLKIQTGQAESVRIATNGTKGIATRSKGATRGSWPY